MWRFINQLNNQNDENKIIWMDDLRHDGIRVCVGFAACSSDDDDNNGGGSGKSSSSVGMVTTNNLTFHLISALRKLIRRAFSFRLSSLATLIVTL